LRWFLHRNSVSAPGQEEIGVGFAQREAPVGLQKCLEPTVFGRSEITSPLPVQQVMELGLLFGA